MQCNTIQLNSKHAMQKMQCNSIQYNFQTFKQLPGNLEQCNETSGQCSAMQYNAIKCNTMQCNSMQLISFQFNTMQFKPL